MGLRGRASAIRADPTYARHLKNSAAPLAEVAFSFDSLPSPSRSVALNVPRLAKCRPERHRLVEVADAIHAESAPLRGERDDSGNQVGNCLGLCAARYSHRGTPLAHTIARTGWYSLYTHTHTHTGQVCTHVEAHVYYTEYTHTHTHTGYIYSSYITYARVRMCTYPPPLSLCRFMQLRCIGVGKTGGGAIFVVVWEVREITSGERGSRSTSGETRREGKSEGRE